MSTTTAERAYILPDHERRKYMVVVTAAEVVAAYRCTSRGGEPRLTEDLRQQLERLGEAVDAVGRGTR